MRLDECRDCLRVGCGYSFALDLSCPIDDADRCLLQRYVQSNVLSAVLTHGVIPGSKAILKLWESALQESTRPTHGALQSWRTAMEHSRGLGWLARPSLWLA